MSALVDRITQVQREHGDGPFINADCTGAGCECGWSGGQDDSWAAHVAERIAEVLQPEHNRQLMEAWQAGFNEGMRKP